jgi:hypothetical protein
MQATCGRPTGPADAKERNGAYLTHSNTDTSLVNCVLYLSQCICLVHRGLQSAQLSKVNALPLGRAHGPGRVRVHVGAGGCVWVSVCVTGGRQGMSWSFQISFFRRLNPYAVYI